MRLSRARSRSPSMRASVSDDVPGGTVSTMVSGLPWARTSAGAASAADAGGQKRYEAPPRRGGATSMFDLLSGVRCVAVNAPGEPFFGAEPGSQLK
jgi:hypothetical protein